MKSGIAGNIKRTYHHRTHFFHWRISLALYGHLKMAYKDLFTYVGHIAGGFFATRDKLAENKHWR